MDILLYPLWELVLEEYLAMKVSTRVRQYGRYCLGS